MTPITKDEMRELFMEFIEPIYQLIGGGLAVIILVLAVILVIKPFIRRV